MMAQERSVNSWEPINYRRFIPAGYYNIHTVTIVAIY